MGTVLTVDADVHKLKFSRSRCFAGEISPEQQRCLDVLAEFIGSCEGPLAFYGAGELCRIILDYAPKTRALVQCILDDNPKLHAKLVNGIPIMPSGALPDSVRTVFLCATRWRDLARMCERLPDHVQVFTLDALTKLNWQAVPNHAWVKDIPSIYPINIPETTFKPNLDMILLDVPARQIAFMPNGFAYVHNALKKSSIKCQTVDLDIIIYQPNLRNPNLIVHPQVSCRYEPPPLFLFCLARSVANLMV